MSSFFVREFCARKSPRGMCGGFCFVKMKLSDNFFSVIEFAFDVGLDAVFHGPFGFVFNCLGVNVFHHVFCADDAGGAADDEGIGRDNLIFHDDGTGGDDGSAADDGARQNGGAHADEAVIFDDAAVHAGAVADGDVIADDARIVIRDVKAGEILDIRAFADGNVIHIAARDDARPNAGVLADADITVEMRARSDESFFMNLRRLAFEFFAGECVHFEIFSSFLNGFYTQLECK